MLTAIQPYIDMILKERSWSWAIVCILYVLAALFVRGWFVGPISFQLKLLDKKTSHDVKSNYLGLSLWGWLLFFSPLFLVVYYWRKDALPFVIKDEVLIVLGLFSFIFSLLLHLQAFGVAGLKTLKDRDQPPKLPDI